MLINFVQRINLSINDLIQPLFDYCDVSWDNLDQGLATTIQKLQNRTVCNLPSKSKCT